MASLYTTVFDDNNNNNNNNIGDWIASKLAPKEEYVYRHYSKTAQRMMGKKYAVLLAKENQKVVGMAELGIVNYSNNIEENNDLSSCGATVGVLAVLPSHQGQGVGGMLLDKCQDVAFNRWNESVLYAAVEPNNEVALRFFKCQNFLPTGQMVPVTVRRNRISEKRPHILLYKNLINA